MPNRLRELAALSYVNEQISSMADPDHVKRSSTEFPFIKKVAYNLMGKIQTFDSEHVSLNGYSFSKSHTKKFFEHNTVYCRY